MKRFLFLATVVLIALSFAVSASAVDYIYGCRVAGDKDSTIDFSAAWSQSAAGVTGSSGAVSTAAGAIDSYGLYISANVPVIGIRTGTYTGSVAATGFYTVSATFGNVNQVTAKTNAMWKIANADGITTVYQDQTPAAKKSKWDALGTFKFNANDAANTKATLTNENQSTSGSLYLQSIKWSSAISGAAIGTGLANGGVANADDFAELNWTAGAYTQLFDVYFGTTSGALDMVAANLDVSNLAFGIEPGSLAGGQTYFWRVDSKNVDNVTLGAEYSFTTNAVPEPGSMLALGTGLIGLFGFIRRKRA